ncbi:MAG: hypothetical protein S4CHLAM7_01280 [Chlamydiae bacterium]|nr:hypothetical protein [Chlamydiota bacterium]
MKKYTKCLLALLVPLFAVFGIYDYYTTLPTAGSYETEPVSYPSIDKGALKNQLSQINTSELKKMRRSGLEVLNWQNILSKVDATVISEVVPDSDPFFVSEHYPYDEVYDRDTESLYYYHSHRPGEHGHFHLFYSNQEVLEQYEPLDKWDKKRSSVHLLALSIHPDGTPLGFFSTNQWITPKEWWYSKETISELVDQFEITHSYPSWPTNQWMNHMLRLFKPQIDEMLAKRDETLQNTGQPLNKALRNKKFDVLSQIPISVETQVEVIEEILSERASFE